MTTLQLAELKILNSTGFSDNEIAAKLGITRETVIRYRKKLGLPAVKDIYSHNLFCYKVYDAKTGKLLASGTSYQVTKQLELSSIDSFYSISHNVRTGKNHKYRIEKYPMKDDV